MQDANAAKPSRSTERLSLVVLVSGSGTNLQAIIDDIRAGQLQAEISAVISNEPSAYGLERARVCEIATEVVDHRAFTVREDFDQTLMAIIDLYQPDLVVLAGFMRILSTAFVEHYSGRMMNIHPSLLPKYRGLHTHRRVLEAGDTVHGSSVHFVTPELDSGPLIIQSHVPVYTDDSEESLTTRVLQEEYVIYPSAIHWFAEGRLRLQAGKVYFDDEVLETPIVHYSQEYEQSLANAEVE